MNKRKVEVVVLSDIHLGTFGCKAKELLNYLKSIQPEMLILNGDIIDIWQFKKGYFPKSHMKVIKYVTSLLTKEVKVYYITGNHDEMLRRFSGLVLGSLEIQDQLILDLDGKKVWIFHGDVFDITMKHSKWLAKLGSSGYDLLIKMNSLINRISFLLGWKRVSLSKKIKNSFKSAVKYISNFEENATEIASYHRFDYVACGHIHQPQIKSYIAKNNHPVVYLNSGDWIENMTALEYNAGKWHLYEYQNDLSIQSYLNSKLEVEEDLLMVDYKQTEIFAIAFSEMLKTNSLKDTAK